MTMQAPYLSLVIPIYNEAESVEPLCRAIREALEDCGWSYEVVLVDDGSTDDSVALLREQAATDPRLRVLALRRNSGQTLAMATGFGHARGRVIVSMDGDLQNDPRDIPRLVERVEHGRDIVCGWRKQRKDAWISRTLPSKVANWMIARITGVRIHDNGCSLKAYRAEVIRSLNLYAEMHRFLPALASMTGARVDELVVRHHPRLRGQSKYGISRTFKVLGDMITIKMITQFAIYPGRWFALLSLPWLCLGGVAGAVWFFGAWGEAAERTVVFSSLTVLGLYAFGYLLTLGVLSELLLVHADRRHFLRLARVLTRESRVERGELVGRNWRTEGGA